MRRDYVRGALLLALSTILGVNSNAGVETAHALTLAQPMVVAGVNLRASAYSVEWELQGSRATVKFAREGRVVATVEGEFTTFDRGVPRDTLYFNKGADGEMTILALGLASTNKGIVFPVVRRRAASSQNTLLDRLMMQDRLHSGLLPAQRTFR